MSSKKYLSIISTALMLFSCAASADVITFKFVGTVNGGNLASAGSQLIGTFSYDTKSKPVNSSKGNAGYRFADPYVMSATVEGHTVSTNGLGVDIADDLGGNVEDLVDIFGVSIQVDGDSYQDGYFGMRLGSGPGNTNVLKNTKLPSSYDVTEFDAVNINAGEIRSDGGQTGLLLGFSIDSVVVIQVCKSPNGHSNTVHCKDY